MPKRIFIGGLSIHTTESELQGLFNGMAGVSAVRLEHDAAGGLRGVAEFSTDSDRAAAMRWLRGKLLHGTSLRITNDQ
jgi:hypothetical protein